MATVRRRPPTPPPKAPSTYAVLASGRVDDTDGAYPAGHTQQRLGGIIMARCPCTGEVVFLRLCTRQHTCCQHGHSGGVHKPHTAAYVGVLIVLNQFECPTGLCLVHVNLGADNTRDTAAHRTPAQRDRKPVFRPQWPKSGSAGHSGQCRKMRRRRALAHRQRHGLLPRNSGT